MRTKITEMFDVEFPLLAFSHCRDVVAAVSQAGGIGVLGATGHTPDRLAIDLKWITEEVRGRPFGIDLLFPSIHAAAAAPTDVPQIQRDFVNELLAKHHLPPIADDAGPGESTEGLLNLVDPEQFAQRLLEVTFDFDIALIASALGSPPAEVVTAARARDIRVAALAGAAKHARRHVEAGADLVVAQGYEAGGHTGEISTMILVPEVVDAVAPTPVVAAGGIGSGRQMASALALGAEGVWCGSVWLTTEEAETDPVAKEKMLTASSADTIRSKARTGKPARQLKSAWTAAWEEPDAPPTLPLPTQYLISEPALAVSERGAQAGNGDARELVSYFVGQVVGSMNQVKPARRVVLEMIEELIDAFDSLTEKINAD